MKSLPVIASSLRLLPHLLGLILVLVLYSWLMARAGGFSNSLSHQWLELPLILYLYSYLYIVLRPSSWRWLLAAMPLLLIYLVHDLFYLAFGKVFRLVNIGELPELLQILPLGSSLLIVSVLFGPLLLLVWYFNHHRVRPLIYGALPLLLLFAFAEEGAAYFVRGFEAVAEIVKYSDAKSVEQNGRLAMLLYREAQRSSTLAAIAPYRDRPAYDHALVAQTAALAADNTRRNVHLVVLESFLDPRLFTRLGFSSAPVHPRYEALFGDHLGLSRGPVFGGATAQAEFEVLCGVPAFEQLSSVEFNVFTGAQAHCLPGQLAALGYRSVSSNTYKPNFFNALPGYQGAGFTESYFPREFSGANAAASYLSFGDPGEEEYLFDGDLFAQNLSFVKRHLQQHPGEPLFNYLLTIYGHTPHLLDPQRRPMRITLQSDYPDDHLDRAVNQFYYRSEAIARYVDVLLAIDPQSLIVLVSDHVPPLRNGPNTYEALRYLDNREGSIYLNRLAIIEGGEAQLYPPMHHYELPALVLDFVSGGVYCRGTSCYYRTADGPERESLRERYLALMAHASE